MSSKSNNYDIEKDRREVRELLQKRRDFSSPADSPVGQELWHIWDQKDGESFIVKSEDYIDFCKNTDRDYWGFFVSKIEFGKSMGDCEDIETYEIHSDLSNK